MTIDKCTIEALKILEREERTGKVEHKALSKRAKIIAIVSAFAVMMSVAGISANAANPAPLTSETIAEAQTGDVYLYTRDYVNVRSTADFTDNIIYVIEPKTEVKLLEVVGDWAHVDVYGVKAYIYSYYLSTKELEYTGDCDDDTDEESVNYLSPADVETEQYSYDGVYYGTTAEGNDVYRNDSGLFEAYSSDGYMTAEEFRNYGIVNHKGECFTYYSERDLPGDGLNIPYRYTDYEGFVCDGDGYIVLATPDEYEHPRGSVIELPTGRIGKFYDFCPEGSIDVYVNW